MTKQKLLLVGLGMVGHRFCERFLEEDQTRTWQLTVLGEELVAPYDRVHLSSIFSGKTPADLELAPASWYQEAGIDLHLGQRAVGIDRERKQVMTSQGQTFSYDHLILATGSSAFVPNMPGTQMKGVFVYRTLDDLAAIQNYSHDCQKALVIGGGLLGLEAAKALYDLGLKTTVMEVADRLMPRQLDDQGAGLLKSSIESLGVQVLTSQKINSIVGVGQVQGLAMQNGEIFPTDMVVISAGIRPRDELARESGLGMGSRGGIRIDANLRTSDPSISAIGECALYEEMIYGLVAPGYKMAEALAQQLCGGNQTFTGADMSTRLKVLGIEVASIGDPFVSGSNIGFWTSWDAGRGFYRKLVYEKAGRKLLGAILVGDTAPYNTSLYQRGAAVDEQPEKHFVTGGLIGNSTLETLICSCENVAKSSIVECIGKGARDVKAVQKGCRAGTGCGSCLSLVKDILNEEMEKLGEEVDRSLCEHFAFSRPELYQLIKSTRIKSFDELIKRYGRTGFGCEICKPTAASIFASLWSEYVLKPDVATLQDTNDRFLANIQKNGTYSVVPRIPAGEITPAKLLVIGRIAEKYELYTKITGGQRIDLFGARLEQLPMIWAELIAAGFESGHAYGKSVRTVKSCVGSTWCRYGVQDSVAMAILIEERYKGIRSPHKIKMAVSGCARECAEAQSKDVGVIATENGWNLYVGGNGGMKPRHADLLAADLDDASLIRFIDRFLIYYIRTADRLMRTSTWIQKLPGGLAHVKKVVLEDAFGIGAEMEEEMASLVASFQCEWKTTLESPDRLKQFRSFINTNEPDDSIQFVRQRGQIAPTPATLPT
ncbi:MAG TPA: nitrite reductase large subunit NirB [Oligoflexus sp.]|uniref:nitrite reductase large subunit NirB n=1 Tax=Oligoflexus sp. TaxID=1971216 RepID=UPI002D4173CF|nr:nitrite reductase large subunit NirB [Oligoflexus sp.]HYX35475.1 nitrite reductase large subunit NirB [Oligoflexus sp.]